MTTVTIPREILPRGYYAAHVVEYGHVPGVLSGAEIKGKSHRFGSWYARQRACVSAILLPFGISSALIPHPVSRRLTRVWVRDGEPVELTLTREATDK